MCHGTIKNTFSASASTLPNVTQKMPTKAASGLNFIAVSKYHSHKSRQEVPKYYRHSTQTWGQYFFKLVGGQSILVLFYKVSILNSKTYQVDLKAEMYS